MWVKVLYFGILRDRIGTADELAELADRATVGELLELLRGRTSNHWMANDMESEVDERLWRSLAVAVNREYASPAVVLRDGDEIALLPPVSGGAARTAGSSRYCADGEERSLLAGGLLRSRTESGSHEN